MQKQKLRCFYTPTQANRLVVTKLMTLERLVRKYNFILLSEDPETRKRSLAHFKGKCVFIWGSGDYHHESHWFTRNSGVKLKINFDYHTDYYRGYRRTDGLKCGDHMSATELDGIKIMIGPSDSDIKRDGAGNIIDKSEVLRKNLEVIERAKTEGILYNNGEIAVTMDGDAILGFPVLWHHASENTISFELFLEAIETLGPRVFRLDFGGLPESIPDFRLLDISQSNWNIPFCSEARQFVSEGNKAPAKIKNKIGSYVTMVYAGLLDAYADSCNGL